MNNVKDKIVVNVELFDDHGIAFESLKKKLGIVNNNDVLRYAVIFTNKRVK